MFLTLKMHVYNHKFSWVVINLASSNLNCLDYLNIRHKDGANSMIRSRISNFLHAAKRWDSDGCVYRHGRRSQVFSFVKNEMVINIWFLTFAGWNQYWYFQIWKASRCWTSFYFKIPFQPFQYFHSKMHLRITSLTRT